jgi:diadenosine tetraphosphatase ApaH/serine/threonine PP2A family protein phosphatase
MRAAALYDIHGNLPALDAVLQDIGQAGVNQIVVGGDVVPGPMPCETLRRLLDLDLPTHFIYGNGELAILAQMGGARTGSVTYWGTTSGARPPESIVEIYRWTAAQLQSEFEPVLAGWPKTLQLEIAGLGQVLFCHSTPRSETEVFTRLTAEDRLLPLFEALNVPLVICGHTHMQFERTIGNTRVVNAGSVGMPFGEPGAYWLLLGPDVELRHTRYDLGKAAERIRATKYPQARDFADHNILQPPSEEQMLEVFARAELT